MIPIMTTDAPFKQWQKVISNIIWQGGKTQKLHIKYLSCKATGIGIPSFETVFCSLLLSLNKRMGFAEK